ncbi:MAG: hypothetical protein V3T77_08880 [Planctomycetota bacterium]
MYILRSALGTEILSLWDWHRLWELADQGGWRPENPEAAVWMAQQRHTCGGRVFMGRELPQATTEALEISPQDCKKMAVALEQMLDDIPNHDAIEAKAPSFRGVSGKILSRAILPGEFVSPLEEFSGERKELVREWLAKLRFMTGFSLRYVGPAQERRTGT